jgi:hypothetical protein
MCQQGDGDMKDNYLHCDVRLSNMDTKVLYHVTILKETFLTIFYTYK